MRLLSRSLLIAAVMVAALAFVGSAGAADITLGPELTGTWETYECGVPSCTYVNDELAGTGANLTSPVTGAIVGFTSPTAKPSVPIDCAPRIGSAPARSPSSSASSAPR
jgi:hypothetical protein